MKTYTPELGPAALARLREYAAQFAPDFPQVKPARWAGVYLHGLLTDGDRESIEPLSRRVTLPDGLSSKDPEQALQQFISQSPWDREAVLRRDRAHLAATFAGPDEWSGPTPGAGRPAASAGQPPTATGLVPPGSVAGCGGRAPAPAGRRAGRDRGPDVGPVRPGAGVAGVRVEAGRVRRRGPGVAADRGRPTATSHAPCRAGRPGPAACGLPAYGRAGGRWNRGISR